MNVDLHGINLWYINFIQNIKSTCETKYSNRQVSQTYLFLRLAISVFKYESNFRDINWPWLWRQDCLVPIPDRRSWNEVFST